MIDRSTREPPSGVTLRVSPNAVLESIDSSDFLAGVVHVGVTTAVPDSGTRQQCAIVVRDSGTRVQQYAPRGGLPRVAARLAKGSCKTS